MLHPGVAVQAFARPSYAHPDHRGQVVEGQQPSQGQGAGAAASPRDGVIGGVTEERGESRDSLRLVVTRVSPAARFRHTPAKKKAVPPEGCGKGQPDPIPHEKEAPEGHHEPVAWWAGHDGPEASNEATPALSRGQGSIRKDRARPHGLELPSRWGSTFQRP
jgi:hypothetical protein